MPNARRPTPVAGTKPKPSTSRDFHAAVLKFLAFHPAHAGFADRLARAVADHATPVGSGTVARNEAKIPVEQRAEAAVIGVAEAPDDRPMTH